MTWTPHGHHIPGTTLILESRPNLVARCGGIGLCSSCSVAAGYIMNVPGKEPDANSVKQENTIADIVREAFKEAGLSHEDCVKVVGYLIINGIMFKRELADESH